MSNSLLRAVAGFALVPALAFAAGPSKSSHACAAVASPEERLACYDAAFPPTVDPVAEAAAREAAQERARQDFGLNRVQLREREPERFRDETPDRIEAKVAGISQRPSGERVVTLDNGQVWLLTEATSKGPLAAGDQVSIKAGAMGSFLLVTPGRATLRARRIR